MTHGEADCLPFGVDRTLGTELVDQIVGNVSLAVNNGTLGNGAQLPGIRRLAKELGVSEITVRRAVKELCRRGVLQARTRVGLTVCGGGRRSWRGVVAGIRPAHDSGMYYANVLEGTIASVLMQNGWLFARMEWPDSPGDAGTDVAGILKCLSPALVVALFPSPAMLNALDRSGLPFVQVWTKAKSRKARMYVRPCADEALSKLAATFKAHGVRKVLSVYQHVSGIDCATTLKNAGFSVKKMCITPLDGYMQPECVQRAALETFDRMLSKGPLAADAVVFNDDYLTAGALTAFERHGVRVPEDIRLATTSNRGLGPVYFRKLARIEVDPVHHGQEIADSLLKMLDGKECALELSIAATFEEGETA
ncbi:MAG: LacI family DNA-binding transcriptional regulator [Eggerthellaceae bacterium]|nr:LacI family DNA-binding transcriptional regulator [Eggerthellaceae bacterium]